MKTFTMIISGLVLMGCGEELARQRSTTVLQQLALAREVSEGVSAGFNLDAQVSSTLDFNTCNQSDFVDSAGLTGIDNQMAKLLPLIDAAGQGAVDALVQSAITEGRMLMFLHVDSTEGSDQVELVFERGEGVPLVGGDGLLLAGQTIAKHPVPELGNSVAVRAADGSIMSEGFPLRLPLKVFTINFELQLPEAHVKLTPTGDGSYDIVLGGWAPIETIVGLARTADERGQDFEETFGPSIREFGDLQFDRTTRTCQAMSLAATFKTVPAFQF
jgi:hypothetical protein